MRNTDFWNQLRSKEEWMELGKEVLGQVDIWERMVDVRIADIYKGKELGSVLQIMEGIQENASHRDIEEKIHEYRHSGASWMMTLSMVNRLCGELNLKTPPEINIL